MKRTAKEVWLGLAVVLALSFSGATLRANDEHEGRGKMNMEKHMEKMTKKLDLTPDQQAQIKKLMEEKWQKMEELNKNYHEQFRNLLTDDQKKKWDAGEAKEKEHKMDHKKMDKK